MLRKVAIENFIRFRERQDIAFKAGANYLIGGNCTGKSSIFELLRRCLSSKENTSYSTVPDGNKPAYVLCHYDLPVRLYKDIMELESEDSDTKHRNLYTGIFVKKRDDGRRMMYKIVHIFSKESLIVLYVDLTILENGERTIPDNKRKRSLIFDNSQDQKETIAHCLHRLIEDGGMQELQELFQTLESIKDDQFKTIDETHCENILDKITETFAATFPLRSIGPLQWNKSDKIKIDNRRRNYKEATEKAEIIRVLIDSKDVNHDRERDIFLTLIYPLEYEFTKNGDGYIECNGSRDEFLKTPEGIIEAKQLALLLAHKKFLTVCLEEPDHGMHPHMIEKMRNLVFRTFTEKVIIMTSHHPSMIGFWTLKTTHVCRRISLEPHVSHSVIPVPVNKVLALEHMKNFLFAHAVLFVEGIDDSKVMHLLFDKVLSNTGSNSDEHLKKCISGIEILVMQGYKLDRQLSKLAKDMGIQYVFLHDCDIPYKQTTFEKKEDRYRSRGIFIKACNERDCEKREQLINDSKTPDSLKPKMLQFFDKDNNINMLGFLKDNVFQKQNQKNDSLIKSEFKINVGNVNNVEEMIKELQRKKVFFWISGDLEDMLCESVLESKTMDVTEKTKLLCKLFSNENKKSSLSALDEDALEAIADCLLQAPEITRFFKYLQENITYESIEHSQ